MSNYLSKVALVLQIFEWRVMIGIMGWQKEKEFTAVLMDLKKDGGKKFKKVENRLIYITSAVVLYICFQCVAVELYYNTDIKIDIEFLLLMILSTDVFVVLGLFISYKQLVYLMKKYHDERY